MAYDHEAIYKAYAGTVTMIDDSKGAFDIKGNAVTLDQSKIDAARATLDAEAAAVKYKTDRTTNGETTYGTFGDQLDMLFKDIDAGLLGEDAKTGSWYLAVKEVKDNNPKPSE